MDLVGSRFSTLSKNEQAYIATTMFGTFQRNRGLTLLSHYSESLKYYENALGAAGTAEQKFNIRQESTAAKMDKLKASWEGFFQSSVDSRLLKGSLDTLTFLMNSMGNLPTLLGIATSALLLWKGSLLLTENTQLTLFKTTGLFTGIIPSLIGNINAFKLSLQGMTVIEALATTATRILGVALNSLKAAFINNPLGVALTGLTLAYTAYEMISQKISQHSQKQKEEFDSLKNSISSLKQETSQLPSLISSYEELSSQTNLTTESKQKLADVMNKLTTIYPNAISSYNLEGDAIGFNTQLLKEYLEQKKQELDLDKQKLVSTFNKQGNKDLSTLGKDQDLINRYQNLLNNKDFSKGIEDRYISKIQELKTESATAFQEIESGLQTIFSGDQRFKDLDSSGLLLLIKTVTNEAKTMGITTSQGLQDIIDKLGNTDIPSIVKNFQEKIKLYQSDDVSYNDLWKEQAIAVEKFNKDLNDLGITDEKVMKDIREKFLLLPTPIKDATNGIIDFSDAIDKIQKKTTDTSDSVELYNQILEKSKTSNNDAAQEVMKHVDKHKELYDVVEVENGVLTLNVNKLEELKVKTIEEATAAMQAQFDKTASVKLEVANRLKEYDVEINKLNTLIDLANAYSKIEGLINADVASGKLSRSDAADKLVQASKDIDDAFITSKLSSLKTLQDAYDLYAQWRQNQGYGIGEDSKESEAMLQRIKNYVEAKQALDKSKALLNAGNLGVKDPSSSSATSAETQQFKEYNNVVKILDNSIQQLINDREKLTQGSEAYRDSIRAEADAKREELKLVQAEIEKYKDLADVKDDVVKITSTSSVSTSAVSKYGISSDITDTVSKIAGQYGIDPALLLAIGQHETGWGSAGAGQNGMYMGYGSYDSGSDYSYAGLDKQVIGVCEKMVAWGMDKANVTIEKLTEGNQGSLPSGIYATDKNWPNAVMQLYNEFSGGTGSTSGTSSKLDNNIAQHYNEMVQKSIELTKEVDSLSSNWWEDLVTEGENAIKNVDEQISFSEAKMQTMDTSSPEYTKELNNQVDFMRQKQDLYHSEKESIDMALASGKLSGDDQVAYLEKAKQLSTDWWTLENIIQDKLNQEIQNRNDLMDKSLDPFIKNIEKIKNQGNLLDSSQISEKANNFQQLSTAYDLYINQLERSIKKKKEETAALDANSKAYRTNQAYLLSLQDALESTLLARQNDLTSQLKQLADEVISLYKEIYQKQKDIALNAIDEQIDAEEKRHQDYLDNIDEESTAFEESVQKRIDALDEEADTEDYNKNLSDKQTERQDILDKINALSLDNSLEAKYQLSELNKELADKDEEIADLQSKHNRDLIKKNLQSQLDAYKKEVEAKKDAEDTNYDATKDSLDKQKQEQTDYYDELINNEVYFLDIRRQIMAGNLSEVESDFAEFGTFLDNNMEEIGTSISTSLIDKMKNAQTEIFHLTEELKKLLDEVLRSDISGIAKQEGLAWFTFNNRETGETLYYWTDTNELIGNNEPTQQQIDRHLGVEPSTPTDGSSNPSDGSSTPSDDNDEHNDFYPYRSEINEIVWLKKVWQEAFQNDNEEGMENAERDVNSYYAELRNSGNSIAKQIASLLTGMDWATALDWMNSNVYHVGGVVGSDSSPSSPNSLINLVNKLFNVQPGEQIVKSLIGELQIPPKNILNNFIPNMQNLINSITPQLSINTNGSNGSITFNQKVIIQNVNANSTKDVNNMIEKVYSKMIDGLNTSGLNTSY